MTRRPFTLFAFICALTSGVSAQLGPLGVSANGRVLIDASGRPVFLLGDTAWNLAVHVNRTDSEAYLQRRKVQGFNAVAIVLFTAGGTGLGGAPLNHYGDAPFEFVAGRPDPARPITTPGADPADAANMIFGTTSITS